MTKDNTPEFLKNSLKFGINLGLERMEALDRALGNPQDSFRAVHIAGTNGKGSTSAFIASILAASGRKVGIYTSPFLERFNERMRIIDGRDGLIKYVEDETYGEIPDDILASLSNEVEKACAEITKQGTEHPTEFELVTAVCYLWFRLEQIDVAVLETGLGGRLDSTNVIRNPFCSVITAMGLDHQDRLGDTIEKICYEKAGIIKSGCPVIISDPAEMLLDEDSREIVAKVFADVAHERDAELIIASAGTLDGSLMCEYDEDGYMTFRLPGGEYKTRLLGDHQVRNAATAIKAAQIAGGVTDEDIIFGISHTLWKGRAELIGRSPVVLLDGGHNYQGAMSLAGVIGKMLGGKLAGTMFRVVMGVMKDKDCGNMLKAMRDGGINIGEVLAVRVNNDRSMDPEELSKEINIVYNGAVKAQVRQDAVAACEEAYQSSLEDGMPLLVSGSLYLIGQVRGHLKSMIKETVNN